MMPAKNLCLTAALVCAGCSSPKNLLVRDAGGFSARGREASVRTGSEAFSTGDLYFRLDSNSVCTIRSKGMFLKIGSLYYAASEFSIRNDSISFGAFAFPLSDLESIQRDEFSLWKTAALVSGVGAGIFAVGLVLFAVAAHAMM